MNFIGYNSNQSNGSCPTGTGSNPRRAGCNSMSTTGMFPGGGNQVYGGGYNPSYPTMVSDFQSSNNFQGQQQYGNQQQQTPRARQQVGRSCPSGARQMQMQPMPQQQMMGRSMCPPQQGGRGGSCTGYSPAAGNPYAPRADAAVMVNVSAATLANARNTPVVADRGEGSVEGNPNVKYIPLNWEDILGKTGMNGMKISMAPSDNPNQNRQLKVSFGGGPSRVDPNSGETQLRVMSFQPVNAGAMNSAGQGSAAIQQNAMNFTVGGQLASSSRCTCAKCQGSGR